jgi:hypothetical protein
MHGISPSRPRASRLGALDFINDVCFALAAESIATSHRLEGKTTYQYVIDQPNPWQESSRAHHCVDLIYLFGEYDLAFSPTAETVQKEMKDRWILFINGKKPWEDAESRFAFAPFGKCAEIGDAEYSARRRVRHFGLVGRMGYARAAGLSGKLGAGQISLLN